MSAKLLADDSGALYIAGSVAVDSPIDFGGGTLAAGTQFVLLKLDAAKKHLWSRRFGGKFGLEQVTTFSFAANGDLLLGGMTGSQTDLGAGPEPPTASNAPQIFVARYDRGGTFVRRYLLPATNIIPVPVGIVEAPSGDILIFGNFGMPWMVGSTTLTPAGTSNEQDIFVVRFSAAGAILDARRYGRARNDLLFDAVGGADGGIYLLGFSYDAVDFGQNPIDLAKNSSSYVVRLDAALTPVWQKLVGAGGSYPRRAWLDGTKLVVAGDTYSSIYYGDSTNGSLPKGSVFVLRIDASNGSLVRGDAYAPEGSGARVTALGQFPAGGVAVGGYLHAPADFGGAALTTLKDHYAPFVARYDGNGQHLWSTLFCSTRLAGGAAGAIAGIARDTDSAVVLLPFDQDLELGTSHFAGGYGTVLADMPPDP